MSVKNSGKFSGRVSDRYTENIEEIARDCDTVFIQSMTYDIESLIEAHLAKDSTTIFDYM